MRPKCTDKLQSEYNLSERIRQITHKEKNVAYIFSFFAKGASFQLFSTFLLCMLC